jgi:hypothetical protein
VEVLFSQLSARYWPLLAVLLVLAVADVLTGTGSALKRGRFDWALVAEFYKTLVLPKVLGWSAVTALAESVTFFALPPEVGGVLGGLIGPGASLAFYVPVVLGLVSSITANLKEIGGAGPDAGAIKREAVPVVVAQPPAA